jgi:hypothetical protein
VVIEESNGGDDPDPGMLLSSRDLSHTSILYMINVGCVISFVYLIFIESENELYDHNK